MTRWMRVGVRVLLFAVLVAGGIWLGQQVMADPGYVLFSVGGYAVEMSFWVFMVTFVVGTVSVWFLTGLVWRTGQLPIVMWRALGSLRRDRADRRVAEGALWLQRGDPARALTLLTKDHVTESAPAVHWILAAMAAAQLEDSEGAQRYLARAETLMTKIPKPVLSSLPPTDFKGLVRALTKHWQEDWVLLATHLEIQDPLTRLRELTRFEKRHADSPMLALAQAKLARLAGLDAEAAHYRNRAQTLAPDDPKVLLEAVEAAVGPHPALQNLATVLKA